MTIGLCIGLLPWSISYWNTDKSQAISKTALQGAQRDSFLSVYTKIHVFYMTLIPRLHLLIPDTVLLCFNGFLLLLR